MEATLSLAARMYKQCHILLSRDSLPRESVTYAHYSRPLDVTHVRKLKLSTSNCGKPRCQGQGRVCILSVGQRSKHRISGHNGTRIVFAESLGTRLTDSHMPRNTDMDFHVPTSGVPIRVIIIARAL